MATATARRRRPARALRHPQDRLVRFFAEPQRRHVHRLFAAFPPGHHRDCHVLQHSSRCVAVLAATSKKENRGCPPFFISGGGLKVLRIHLVLKRSRAPGLGQTPLCTWHPPRPHVRCHDVAQMQPMGQPRLRAPPRRPGAPHACLDRWSRPGAPDPRGAPSG